MEHNSFERVTVCLMDCGILRGTLAATRIVAGVNLTDVGDADDLFTASNSHGTQVADTILSECPETRLAVLRVMDDNGWLHSTDVVEQAFSWVLANRSALGPIVVCAAFGDMFHYRSDEAFRETALCAMIRELRAEGVLTVTAAGNMYPRFCNAQPQGMAWPAILRETVSVGALDVDGDVAKLDWSSQRLHASLNTGCATSMFAVPGPPGETSGAAARVSAKLAQLRVTHPNNSADELLERLMSAVLPQRDDVLELSWPTL